jgi:hypothetical protein
MEEINNETLRQCVEEALKGLIEKFKGTYRDEISIDKAQRVSDTEILVQGKVKYRTKNCGNVHTAYKVRLILRDSGVTAEPNIYTPYGFLNGLFITGYEWDKEGYITQLGFYAKSVFDK